MSSLNGNKPQNKPASRISIVQPGSNGDAPRLLPRMGWATPRPLRLDCSEWVRALAERWGRGFGKNDRLSMILLRPLIVTRHLKERWLLKSQRFSPRIKLSAQVFLRATSSTVFPHSSSRELVLVDRHFQASERGEPYGREIMPGLASGVESPGVEYSGYRDGGGIRDVGKPGRIEMMSPLDRVFVRSESLIEPREFTRRARIESIIERLTRQSARIESHFSASSTTTPRPVIAHSVNQSRVLSAANDKTETPSHLPGFEAVSQTRMNRERGWDPSHMPRVESEISIERITDQVIKQLDRRVVAARERVGRTF